MSIQIGKYKRPGVFTEYEDQSIFTNPTQGGLATLILGFSKKGPFNTPIYLENIVDREQIFGTLDRNLERKGSYFHRTIDKTLELSPVYAINLLKTDDELDKVEYKSISTKPSLLNAVNKEGAYRRVFDTTGFWKRDEQAFLALVKSGAGAVSNNDTQLLHFTNVSGQPITVFVFKTRLSGFDRTLIEWYGSVEKMPAYLNESDFASDYMVDVLVVAGDWSNYSKLSVDNRWSRYFSNDGLKKEQVYNFSNDKNVNTLRLYEGLSLIPWFRDSFGNNIFLEHKINADTERTGLFCAFNSDLFESANSYNGYVDLIGNALTQQLDGDVEYLSYKFNLGEIVSYPITKLDTLGNVISLHTSSRSNIEGLYSRTGYNSELLVYNVGVSFNENDSKFEFISNNGYVIKSGVKYTLPNGSVDYPTTFSNYVVLTVDINGVYKLHTLANTISDSDIIVASADMVENSGVVDVVGSVNYLLEEDLYTISDLIENKITIKFNTANATKFGMRLKANRLANLFNIDVYDRKNGALLLQNNEKMSLNNLSYEVVVNNSNNITDVIFTLNADLVEYINTNITQTPDLIHDNGTSSGFIQGLYISDNEFVFGDVDMKSNAPTLDIHNGSIGYNSKFYIDYINGVVTSGDIFIHENIAEGESNPIVMYINSDNELIVETNLNLDNTGITDVLEVKSGKSNFVQNMDIEIIPNYEDAENKILVLANRYTEVKMGDFLEAAPGSVRNVARILSKRIYKQNSSYVEITTDLPINKVEIVSDRFQVKRFTKIEDYVSTYNGINLRGFNVREASMPNGTEERQNEILNIVAQGTHLYKSIINKETFDFRYLIDSFGLGLTENSKQQLADICGARLDCFGFLNMPSLRDFRNSSSPSFVDEDGIINVEYISLGANPESNPAFNYSFATGEGATAVGYFFPYVKVNSDGASIEVPPAMYIANTYLRKHRNVSSNVTPWTIVAGITNGRVQGITGVEIELSGEDIEFMMQAQMNPIVWKRNRGYVIESENTALTLYKSTLGSIHVREVLIELERELSAMLLDFQWKYNTPDVRAEIKLRADVICQNFVTKKGLYAFFNKCDDENNTRELIENEIGLLSTYVEPVMGLKILVNKITILRNGTIDSAGFSIM